MDTRWSIPTKRLNDFSSIRCCWESRSTSNPSTPRSGPIPARNISPPSRFVQGKVGDQAEAPLEEEKVVMRPRPGNCHGDSRLVGNSPFRYQPETNITDLSVRAVAPGERLTDSPAIQPENREAFTAIKDSRRTFQAETTLDSGPKTFGDVLALKEMEFADKLAAAKAEFRKQLQDKEARYQEAIAAQIRDKKRRDALEGDVHQLRTVVDDQQMTSRRVRAICGDRITLRSIIMSRIAGLPDEMVNELILSRGGTTLAPLFTSHLILKPALRTCAACLEDFHDVDTGSSETAWRLKCLGYEGDWMWTLGPFPSSVMLPNCNHELDICCGCVASSIASRLDMIGRQGVDRLIQRDTTTSFFSTVQAKTLALPTTHELFRSRTGSKNQQGHSLTRRSYVSRRPETNYASQREIRPERPSHGMPLSDSGECIPRNIADSMTPWLPNPLGTRLDCTLNPSLAGSRGPGSPANQPGGSNADYASAGCQKPKKVQTSQLTDCVNRDEGLSSKLQHCQ
ncbi:hypothetical protein MKZ38_010496 [Zalerion maritima]|uniref:Uncharacterized protein n=1 Tax=Zalerion maritima TaxID=339359 RepID=A0AAD5WU62_9PEZI|nr:hypothetical protein MKZ38_010496 [Zalerion maritima]